jgi:hypothetical protein
MTRVYIEEKQIIYKRQQQHSQGLFLKLFSFFLFQRAYKERERRLFEIRGKKKRK